uniref:Uncharacterized mitochondrial protein AtMg00810-like n=1 Tax=Nicotiana tabacum TaxID=4097 RepID=A0A1S3XP84_TOBAC|nr:PREDICTED: uncharacterized mitochondrial protein AtMg00810-like [Nicotiana tabacum]
MSEISALKSYLDEQFKIKDLGTLHYFLGIEVSPTPAVVFPLDLSLKLQAANGDLLPNPKVYRSLISKFNFLTHTMPGLSFVVQHLSQFLQSPRVPHYSVALHLLRYLKGTSGMVLFLIILQTFLYMAIVTVTGLLAQILANQ